MTHGQRNIKLLKFRPSLSDRDLHGDKLVIYLLYMLFQFLEMRLVCLNYLKYILGRQIQYMAQVEVRN